MKNTTTNPKECQQKPAKSKESIVIDEADKNNCISATERFFSRFKVLDIMNECGAYKEKGVPVSVILMYVFTLMFSPISMYFQIKTRSYRETFCKNTVYRFLENVHMNWQLFLLKLAKAVICDVRSLTDGGKRYSLIVDDTPLSKRGKRMELVCRYFNHVDMRNENGYRILTVAWTDGVTTLPVMYTLLSSSNDDLVRGYIKEGLDGRSLAARIRKMARTPATDLTIKFVKQVKNAGIKADFVLFDSWFTGYRLITTIVKEAGMTVISRVKTESNQYFELNGKQMTLKQIYCSCTKRRGKAKWKLSVTVNLLCRKNKKIIGRLPVKLVFVPNRAKNDEYICILCTDTEMGEDDIRKQYAKRWQIEVMFKSCKQYLKLGKDFQCTSFEAQNAQIAICYARYMMIALERREEVDQRSFGEIFWLLNQEMADISLGTAMMILVSLFKKGLKEVLHLPEESIQKMLDYVTNQLPDYLSRTLKLVNGVDVVSA